LEPRGGEVGDGALLCVCVSNTGSAPTAAAIGPHRAGVGLRNLEQRIRRHYGATGSLRIECRAEGTRVEVRLPAAPGLVEREPVPVGERLT
jgi:LytS/YehU family sensor histidine kinase